jgi:hypothetical protein
MSGKRLRLSRRALLRGAGGVAVGLPMLEIMSPLSRALAATTPPKRFIVFFTPDGTIRTNWAMDASATETSFTLSRILTPLAANQQHIVVLDGITNVAATKGDGDDHMRGMGAMLTGTELLPGTTMGGGGTPAGLAGGISVDQAIANGIGTDTKFKSLELGVLSGGGGTVWAYTGYTGPNQPLPPDNNPASVFNRVFSQLGTNSAELMRIQAERKSVLDAVIGHYTRLNPKLGTADKAKLDEHLSNIRDLENRLTAPLTVGASCTKPAAPTIDYKANDNFPAIGKLQTDLLVMAMACDLTRVGTLQWERSVGDVRFTFVDPAITRGHHDMSHDPDSNADTQEALTKINVWFAQQLNYLIERLKAVPEGNGGSMLDSTLILWVNELAKGNAHSHNPMPFVLAGHAAGALRTGRYLKFANSTPHNNLLVSCMNLMGVAGTTFGNPAYCTGPLANL